MDSDKENPQKKQCLENTDKNVDMSLTPRSYQIEILETAKKENTIACLGTGTGKTFIAVMLIREFASDVRLPFEGEGKRIFFLVPTVPLVHQQANTISDHTDLKVKKFCGEMNVDSWNKDKWTSEFKESEVLVMTAEIFRIIVAHAFIPLKKIKLIIFDECHRAHKDHPYAEAMKCFTGQDSSDMPRIFGLSASLINGKCKPHQLEKQLIDLEKTLRSSICTASDIIDLQKYGADPNEFVVCFKPYVIETDLFKRIEELKQIWKNQQKSLGRCNETVFDAELEFFDKPLKCLNAIDTTLRTLGPWCAFKAAEVFKEEVGSVLEKQVLFKEGELDVLVKLVSFLEYFMDVCKKIDFKAFDKQNWPHKLLRLLEVFIAVRNCKKFLKQPVPVADASFTDDPENYFQIIKNKQKEDESEIQMCSIVFVEQRITAYVLEQWVLEMKKIHPELDFLKPNYIVGHGSTGIKRTSMSEKRQKAVLSDFREKKCNILISTNVLEEGMDVQQCNIVVRFDLPGDFRGYVQSKGRARAKDSIYVLMSETGEKHVNFITDMINFKTIEQLLLSKCHNRNVPSEEEINEFMSDNLIPPYMPRGKNGPRITLVSAISVINRYCANLPSDMATKLTAKWFIREIESDSPVVMYECTLKMPINSPLKALVVGQPMKRKKLAKMAAALKACQLLDELGEFNEHLVPISSLLQQNVIDEELGPEEKEEVKFPGTIPGTKKRRQVYDRHVPIFLQNCKPQPHSPCYLHVIKMNLAEPLPPVLNPRKRPILNPSDSPRGLGLLLSKKLPKVNSFPVFTKMGKIVVTISNCVKEFNLSDSELRIIEEFHHFVFLDALCLEKNKTFSPNSSKMPLYVVPITGRDSSSWIDWTFLNEVKNHEYHILKKKTSKTVGPTAYNKNLFKNAVLLRSYKMDCWKFEKPTFHHVIEITDKTPNSSCDFSEADFTFHEYYKSKYGIDIQDNQQPLVETYTNRVTVNWKPLYVSVKEVFEDSKPLSKSKQRHQNFREFLVPELSLIHPFSTEFFHQVQVLPTVLFRLSSLLLAEELRQSVAGSGLVGCLQVPDSFQWPYFNLETSDKELKMHLTNKLKIMSPIPKKPFIPQDIIKSSSGKIESFTKEVNLDNHPGPDPSLLLQAITSKSAGDEFDLERLEMIGDSFLKYVISVKTYFKYPTFDEGKLTKLRSRIIQNLHLYQLAKKKNLGKYLINTPFSCEDTWLPPCYAVDEVVDERILDPNADHSETAKLKQKFFTKQVINDKCIADAVEALIGAYLLTCGQKGAVMFMHWIGLDPIPHEKDVEVRREDFLSWPPNPPSVIIGDIPNVEVHLRRLTDGLQRFEESINYRFKDKALLLQAFTHPSFFYNEITDCYQRLEFLGDAVLDFLITRQLYEDPNDHSPGKLTDLRSALVNNIYFASLAVKYKYHKHLKMLSSHLFGLMNNFLKAFEGSDSFQYFKEHGYYLEEIECFALDEVEVPKALGDIFESVAGAIYLDSGMSLDTVWKVHYPMISPAMSHLSEHVPMSPVRELHEKLKRKDVFTDIVTKGEKTYVKVILPNGKEIVGVGPNKKVAKRSAAKRALAELRCMENC